MNTRDIKNTKTTSSAPSSSSLVKTTSKTTNITAKNTKPGQPGKRGRPRKYPLPSAVETSASTSSGGIRGSSNSWASSPQEQLVPSTSREIKTEPDTMVLGPEEVRLTSSARQMRNLAEKMRRDKLNTYVSELSSILPLVAETNKKVDKTSVLRLAANYIRMHTLLARDKPSQAILPEGLPHEATYGLMEILGNQFLLVVTNTGKIVFASDVIEQTFGHSQVEVLGSNIFSLVHPDDHELLKAQLKPRECTQRSFFCRLAEKSLSRNETRRYEIIHVQGRLRPVPPRKPPYPQSGAEERQLQLLPEEDEPPVRHRRSTRHYGSIRFSEDDSSGSEDRDDKEPFALSDTHLLVALVKLIKDRPITELSRMESTRDEYITRHDALGTILYSDHRMSYVVGYSPETVCGTSAFLYMHKSDLLWSLVAHKQMFGTQNGQGEVSYRLRCLDNSYVTLRSRGYLEYNKQTGKLESFVCINTVVESKDEDKEVLQQRRQLLPLLQNSDSGTPLANISSDIPMEILEIAKQTLSSESIQQLIGMFSPSDFTPNGIVVNSKPNSGTQQQIPKASVSPADMNPMKGSQMKGSTVSFRHSWETLNPGYSEHNRRVKDNKYQTYSGESHKRKIMSVESPDAPVEYKNKKPKPLSPPIMMPCASQQPHEFFNLDSDRTTIGATFKETNVASFSGDSQDSIMKAKNYKLSQTMQLEKMSFVESESRKYISQLPTHFTSGNSNTYLRIGTQHNRGEPPQICSLPHQHGNIPPSSDSSTACYYQDLPRDSQATYTSMGNTLQQQNQFQESNIRNECTFEPETGFLSNEAFPEIPTIQVNEVGIAGTSGNGQRYAMEDNCNTTSLSPMQPTPSSFSPDSSFQDPRQSSLGPSLQEPFHNEPFNKASQSTSHEAMHSPALFSPQYFSGESLPDPSCSQMAEGSHFQEHSFHNPQFRQVQSDANISNTHQQQQTCSPKTNKHVGPTQ